jgi:hypothetical protein
MATVPYRIALVLIVRNDVACGVVKCPKQPTYQEQLDERIAAKHVIEAKERNIPLWMLRGFPALSNEPDQDDPIDFL